MSRSYFALSVLVFILCISAHAQQNNPKQLPLDSPSKEELSQTSMFIGRYVFNINQDKVVQLKSDKWFFFVEIEPDETNEWVGTSIQLSTGLKNQQTTNKIKDCDSRKGGVDSCFLTNKQFDYKTQSIHVQVRCRGKCIYNISAQISTPYKLFPGTSVVMDFQNTAYSQIFTVDTNGIQNFDQLRIILKPIGFLQFAAPIGLYVNQDSSLPTREVYDLKGITLWDNGQGIFLDQPDATGIFTILVQGPQKNVLQLSVETVSLKNTNSLTQNLPYFDYLGQGSSKNYKAKVNPAKGVCLQLTTFSGSINLARIYDENMNEIDQQFPTLFRSYGQLQYQISAQFFKDNKDKYQINNFLIFKIQGVKQSTFLVESYELIEGISHLNPEITRYVELPASQYNQYYIDLAQMDTRDFTKSQFQIILTLEEKRNLDVRFFQCKKQHGVQCQLKKSQLDSKQVNQDSIKELKDNFQVQDFIDGVKIYKFNLPASSFSTSSSNSDVKRYLLSVLISNRQDTEQLYTIQYINYGKSVYLKEGQVKTDNIAIDQSKYYVFTNTNKEVKQIRIHVMEISGRVFLEGYFEDPRLSDMEGKQILDYHNAVRYNNVKENKTIYLKVTGKEAAYYSVQLQLLKQNQRDWWRRDRTDSSKVKGYNQVILVEDIPYEFHIEANQKVVYQLHTKSDDFFLDISSLLPLQLCMTQVLQKQPFAPNCQVVQNLTKNTILLAHMQKGKIVNMGVQNNNDKSVKFNIKFYAQQQNTGSDTSTNNNKCFPAVLGKMVKYNFKKDFSSCYSFYLNKLDDIEVVIDVVSSEYKQVNTIADINNAVQKVQILGTTHIFKSEEISKACGSKDISNCPIKIFISSKVDTEIRLTAQYISGTIYLLDGISNTFSGNNDKRTFIYELENILNTTVILEDKKGYHKFYAKVVEANDYWKQKVGFPSSTSKDLQSANPFYFTYQILTITVDQIKESKCIQCILLITVQKQNPNTPKHQKPKFTIECTQQNRFLQQNRQVIAYLGKHSVDFYQFYNPQPGAILVNANTQNQDCIKIFMKKGIEVRATGSDYDKKSQTGTLMYENAEEGNYAITLEATEECHYTIDITTSSRKLFSTIQRGLYTDIILQKNSSQTYIYKHELNESIKILTLHQTGELILNVISYPTLKDLLSDENKKIKYTWSGKDYLKIDAGDAKMCFDCYYLIVISAERNTKSSIMIPSKDSEFPIRIDSTIKDQLKKDQVQKLRIFTDKIAQFQIIVVYGSINITVIDSYSNKNILSQIYKANTATQYANLTNNQDKTDQSFAQYSKIIITGVEDSSFSFGLISDKDVNKRGIKVKYGIPQYVSLSKGNTECLRGILDDSTQQFLISLTGDNQVDLMNNLQISCQIDSKFLNLKKNIAKNQMIVTIQDSPKIVPASFDFCLKSNQTIFLTFIQSSKLNYFPEGSKIMVAKQMNLSFYTEGKSLIEINECTSRAVTTVSSNFKEVSGTNSDIKQVRKTNNIIQFTYYGPVYVHVKADSATVSWRTKDQSSGKGYGYDDYSTTKIRIDKSAGFLKVQVFPLRKLNTNSLVKFQYVNYTSYIAEQQMNLYDAINCNNGIYLSQAISTSDSNDSAIINFDIQKILSKFMTKKYVLVGVLADAKPINKDDGNYRFIYSYLQVPISLLTSDGSNQHVNQINGSPSNVINTKNGSDILQALLYIGLTLLTVILVIFIYRKWIRRMIKRRRRQKLSDQAGGEVKYQQFTSFA